jgi:DNA-directed RNA polymerase specialized sigma24 family protein
MSNRPTDGEFSDFVAAVWRSLYRTAYLMVGTHALAEDLVQTALTNTYASWHKVRELGAARAYARTAVVRSTTSWFRTRARRQTSAALSKLRTLLGDTVVPSIEGIPS